MMAYVARRLLYMIPILLGVTLVVFFLFNVAGGNPVYQMLGKNASPEEIALLERQLGLDQPLWKQYVLYLWDLLRLDFGRSWETGQRISEMILSGLGPSLALALPAFLLGSVLGLLIAMVSALNHNRLPDRLLVVLSVLGMSVSILAFIIAGQYLFAFIWALFPISGYESGLKGLPYLVLPVLIWVVTALGADVRFYRTVMLEEIGRDYVTAARAKGLSRAEVMVKHVLKNAMLPILTQMGIILPALFTGSLLLETFFGIPGLGNMVINAVNASDFPVIKAMTFVGAVLYMGVNLVADVLYAVFDPRVKLG